MTGVPARRHATRTRVGLCLMGWLAACAVASAEVEPSASFGARVDVSIVDLSVVVRDGEGRPITGLRRENFRVLVDGAPQELSNFAERRTVSVTAGESARSGATGSGAAPEPTVTAEPGETTAATSWLVIFFDNLHLHPLRRNAILGKLVPFVDRLFGQGPTKALVVAFDRQLQIVQRFTADPAYVRRGLEEAAEKTGGGLFRMRERTRLKESLLNLAKPDTTRGEGAVSSDVSYQLALQSAQSLLEAERDDLRRSLQALTSVTDLLAGLVGRKAILYVSDGIQVNPATEIFSFLDQVYPLEHVQLQAMNYDQTDEFKQLTARCNAFGVTLYPLSAGGLDTHGEAGADQERTWDPRYRSAGIGELAQIAVRDAANLLAGDTGGLAIVDTNQIDLGLHRVDDDLRNYYSLGIPAPAGAVGSYRLQVELVGVEGEHEVRVRRGFGTFGEDERMRQRVVSRLYLPGDEDPLGLRVQFLASTATRGGEARVPMVVHIPWKSLFLQLRAGQYQGEIEALLVFMDAEGKVSAMRNLRQAIVLPEKYFEAAQGESYHYTIEMFLKPGRWTIALAVRDVGSGVTSYLRRDRNVSTLAP